MYDLHNMNIWKNDNREKDASLGFASADIMDLGLSTRPYNSLKRAGIGTVGQVLEILEDKEGPGLKRIRNLGNQSEREIREKIETYRILWEKERKPERQKKVIIKPAKNMWDTDVDVFGLSERTLKQLRGCGIYKVKDLYMPSYGKEPGWYAVRELFARIPTAQ